MNLNKVTGAGVVAIVGLSLMSAGVQAQAGSTSADKLHADASTDDDLARVKQALHSNHAFDDKHINVSIEEGKVVLRGFVASQHDLEAALTAAKKAVSAGKLINRLAIKQSDDSNGSG